MANNAAPSRPNTEPHPLVAKVLDENGAPKDQLVVLLGYFGPTQKEGYARLYTGLHFRSYYDIPMQNVLHTEQTVAGDANSPTRVYVTGSTTVDFVLPAEASYLQAALASGDLARATAMAGAVGASACPGCSLAMPSPVPSLWPENFEVRALPPFAILKAQEEGLAQHTQGKLEAKLTESKSDLLVQYQLDLIAPSPNFYRERLLSATHERGRHYPVVVTSEYFAPQPLNPLQARGAPRQRQMVASDVQRRAATQDELIRLVSEVLHSEDVRSLIQSLIARINESPPGKEGRGNGRDSNSPDRDQGEGANPHDQPPRPAIDM